MEGEDVHMKIKGLLITGILLLILGVGITAVAATQINFKDEFYGFFSDPTLEEKNETFAAIKKITYDGSDENLEIVYSAEENSFTYYEGDYLTYDIQYDEEEKELHIIQNHSFSFIHFSFGFTNKKAILSINSELEELLVDTGAGNIALKGLTVKTTKLDVSASNLKLENMTIESLDILSSAGNVNLNHVAAKVAKFDLKAGNLKIEESSLQSSTIDVSAGNVNLLNCSVETLDAKLSAGNLHFKGDILVHADVKLSAGNLELRLERGEGSYCVNGVGDAGMTTILYHLSAGNSKVYYEQ